MPGAPPSSRPVTRNPRPRKIIERFYARRGLSLPLACFVAAYTAIVACAALPNPSSITYTLSGKAKFPPQNLKVSVVSNNFKILMDPPANQTVVTETLVELLQNNSVLFSKINGGQNILKNTYSIYGELCIPLDASTAQKIQTVQLLTHGDTLNSTYWDIATGYS